MSYIPYFWLFQIGLDRFFVRERKDICMWGRIFSGMNVFCPGRRLSLFVRNNFCPVWRILSGMKEFCLGWRFFCPGQRLSVCNENNVCPGWRISLRDEGILPRRKAFVRDKDFLSVKKNFCPEWMISVREKGFLEGFPCRRIFVRAEVSVPYDS